MPLITSHNRTSDTWTIFGLAANARARMIIFTTRWRDPRLHRRDSTSTRLTLTLVIWD